MKLDRGQQPTLSRRAFIKAAGGAGIGFALYTYLPGSSVAAYAAPLPGGTLDPATVDKFVTPLLIPPVMPRAGTVPLRGRKNADYYEISLRQFNQQILPDGFGKTTVWGYGPVRSQNGRNLIHNAPSLTIEAEWDRPVRIKWVNDLVDEAGAYLPHLLPVDPTLHWANPPGGVEGRDREPQFEDTPGPYTGPVPMVTHVHGARGVGDESDGYAEAWYLPDATNIPAGYAEEGTWYDFFEGKASAKFGVHWGRGYAVFQYPNASERARANWYHDHTLGMTRLNVYTGPAGFYIIRGGPDDKVVDTRTGGPAILPGPAPKATDPQGRTPRYYEIPLAIQDRAFNEDGSLFYPDSRAFFDEITGPYIPEADEMGFSPIWNPEFFGNTIIVNGSTWPDLEVEQRRYRFRALNGCQSRFLILDFNAIEGVEVWAIGNEGGFLPAPVDVTTNHGKQLLLAPAERADLIVDFTNVPTGAHVLNNVGPDDPFGGGVPGTDFVPADVETTGQTMQFSVVPRRGRDRSTPPEFLRLPALRALPEPTITRQLALIEMMGMGEDADGVPAEGPLEALLGRMVDGKPQRDEWHRPVTENPAVGRTEVWEFWNTTGDAHPIHIHEVAFEVVSRQPVVSDDDGTWSPEGEVRGPEPWELGVKDTITAYPGEVTRVKAKFDVGGQYVWHCHILEHEDNEMMRPFRVGPEQKGQPGHSMS